MMARKELVAVVSESAAQRIWPGENPIGQKFRNGTEPALPARSRGRGGHANGHAGANQQPRSTGPTFNSVARDINLAGSHGGRARNHRAAQFGDRIWSVDRGVPVPELRTIAGLVSEPWRRAGFRRSWSLLSLCSPYVLAYRYIRCGLLCGAATAGGDRSADGARREPVGNLLADAEARHAAGPAGLGSGSVDGDRPTRLMTSLLFEVRALDPVTFFAAPLLLALVAALACYLPARRAGRLDPMDALRYE